MDIDRITGQIVDAAICVHRELGLGLLESAYQFCLNQELLSRGFQVQLEVPVPIIYKGEKFDCGYRLDMLVENQVVVELKAVEKLEPVHMAQILTCLKLSKNQIGLILNFNVSLMKQGIRRVIHNPNS